MRLSRAYTEMCRVLGKCPGRKEQNIDSWWEGNFLRRNRAHPWEFLKLQKDNTELADLTRRFVHEASYICNPLRHSGLFAIPGNYKTHNGAAIRSMVGTHHFFLRSPRSSRPPTVHLFKVIKNTF